MRVETGLEEGGNEVGGEPRPNDLGSEAHDVHVVVLDALMGAMDVVANGGANSGDLVCGDTRAHTGAANQQATVGPPRSNAFTNRPRDVGKNRPAPRRNFRSPPPRAPIPESAR
jgi:hypothetical protein